MINPTTAEIVAVLRRCVEADTLACENCVITGNTNYDCKEELMLIAADHIEELEIELAALKERTRWRPATELPKEE